LLTYAAGQGYISGLLLFQFEAPSGFLLLPKATSSVITVEMLCWRMLMPIARFEFHGRSDTLTFLLLFAMNRLNQLAGVKFHLAYTI
jgi:hypothetical protein